MCKQLVAMNGGVDLAFLGPASLSVCTCVHACCEAYGPTGSQESNACSLGARALIRFIVM